MGLSLVSYKKMVGFRYENGVPVQGHMVIATRRIEGRERRERGRGGQDE